MSGSFIDALGRLTRTPAFKFFLIGGLILLLLVPLFMVWALVQERESNASTARLMVGRSWGADQRITGPFLIVPYSIKQIVERAGKRVEQDVARQAVFLPELLNVEGSAKSKILTRSIYDATVYRADIKITGRFAAPDIARIAPDAVNIRWQDAVFALGLNVSGLKNAADLIIDGQRKIPFEPSVGVIQGKDELSGLHARPFDTGSTGGAQPGAFSYELSLAFTGASTIVIAPAGRETTTKLTSDWPHPSFIGAFLPATRSVGPEGFTASWTVPHLARSVPHSWTGATAELDKFASTMFGVSFYIPIDHYDLVNRAAKYGLMFLLVAFGAVFVLELLSGSLVHPVQYIFVGAAMVFFFVLLLSLGEHLGFAPAYIIAAGATGIMLSLYVGMAMQSSSKGLVMSAVFVILYGLLYLILTLEDYALLAGAIAGFVLLTITMFVTLRVNWSGKLVESREEHGPA